ncbi:hypothetical protein NLJ89_g11680 [Agrocybe chaxingu]|uniref:Uncharacterized protein n=1 Tax=Agrocybe chaxingu TaxID=84603 RepID=A0A9W8MQY7_9AGAR|nr:hypothetical protein NLJ89_g11680 [Agrocybe chaxingu]
MDSMGTNADTHTDIVRSLTNTRQILEAFRIKSVVFLEDVPSIIFAPDFSCPLPLNPPQPPLGLNERFLFHRQAINRDLDSLDAIPTCNSIEVRLARKAAIAEVLEHLDHLDGLLSAAWAAVLNKENLAQYSLNAIEKATQEFRQELLPFKHSFIAHRDRVSKILETLDAVPSHNLHVIRNTRKAAVNAIVEYITKIESWINEAHEQLERAIPVERGRDISKIDQLLGALRAQMDQFDITACPVTFLGPGQDDPNSAISPPLPTSPNKEFLRHRSAVENILHSIESLPAADTTMTERRDLAIEETRAHLDYLTTMKDSAWAAFLQKE